MSVELDTMTSGHPFESTHHSMVLFKLNVWPLISKLVLLIIEAHILFLLNRKGMEKGFEGRKFSLLTHVLIK